MKEGSKVTGKGNSILKGPEMAKNLEYLENAKVHMTEELATFTSLINLRRFNIIFIILSLFINFDTNMYITNDRIMLGLLLIRICLWRFFYV